MEEMRAGPPARQVCKHSRLLPPHLLVAHGTLRVLAGSSHRSRGIFRHIALVHAAPRCRHPLSFGIAGRPLVGLSSVRSERLKAPSSGYAALVHESPSVWYRHSISRGRCVRYEPTGYPGGSGLILDVVTPCSVRRTRMKYQSATRVDLPKFTLQANRLLLFAIGHAAFPNAECCVSRSIGHESAMPCRC
eukprot:762561-Hanusia_phi.AAC.10